METLTIRIEEDLKDRTEKAAKAEGQSVTEFVAQALKARIAPQCGTCGRSDQQGAIPAGFVEPLNKFIEEFKREHVHVVVTTFEWGRPFVYLGRIVERDSHAGMLVLDVVTGTRSSVRLPIPRGAITGWGEAGKGRYEQLLAVGYANGNGLATLRGPQTV